MYNVSANFHTLSIQDAPNTRVRIYFIGDGVDCTDDNDVTTNGTLLKWAVGDTDSNGRIGQDGIKFTEYYNPEYNVTIGRAVSSQVEMTLLNTDGALDNFAYGRCKIYLDVYDSANSTWLSCPMGVYIIDLPTRRKSQLIHAFGYDQMQKLDGICDTWWAGLNFSGGLTLLQIVNSMASQIGVSVSTATASAIVNSSVTYTAAPFDCVETTYREVLELIAEATGTVARFDRDGALDLKWFKAAQIGGNTVEIDTDTIGNQCLSIDLAEYQAAAIDLLKVKIAEDDVGVTVGSGTNQYTILDNLFLDGTVATITTRATAIYNRLNALGAYKPIQSKLIWDWSIEAGDIIEITRDSTTYTTPIFQQTMTWRGGYVVSELVNSGDNVRPVPNYDERSTYRMQSEMSAKVGDNEIISKINQSPEAITIQASKVNLTGYVTFTNLSTPGQTTIDGGNLVTGTVTANKLDAADINASKTLTVGAMTDAAAATILNSNIQIGGRNLAMGTATPKTVTTIANRTWYLPPVYSISAYGATAIADTNNTQVTISFDYTITGVDTAFTLVSCLKETSSAWGNGITFNSVPVGNSSGHAEGTKNLTAGERQYAGTDGILFSGSGNANANSVLTVSNLKVEIGNKATTWTQAPEDVAADIATAQSTADSANSQEQLIYISKVSGTIAQSGTTTWVTDATGNQNTWTIKRPTYNSSYPVLFVATQRKNVAGTVTCTTPQIDNTTTVIDGGHITTGTIDASVVSVTNLNASNITSGTLSANYISGGTMTVGGLNNTNGYIRILDSTGNYAGGIGYTGVDIMGEEPFSGLSHVLSNAFLPWQYSIYDQTTQKQLALIDATVVNATDEYSDILLYGYDNGTQVSSAQLYAYPYSGGSDHGAYLLLTGPDGLVRLNSDGTYAGDLTMTGGNLTVGSALGGVLDVVDRRCSAELSSENWYRVMKYSAASAASAIGAVSFNVDFVITRAFNNTNNETHKISLIAAYNNISFVGETSKSNAVAVDKIRYMQNGSDAYVDIHYNVSVSNGCYVDMDVHTAQSNKERFTSVGFSTVGPSPAGETELANYTFVANTGGKITFTPTSGSVYRGCWYARIGNVCYLHVDMQGLTPSTNTKISTLPLGFRPEYSTTIPGAGQESYGALASCSIQTDGSVYIYSQDHYAIVDGSFICLT